MICQCLDAFLLGFYVALAIQEGRHTWSPEASERETGEAVMIDNNPELTDLMRAHGFVDANGLVEAHFPAYWRDPFCFNDFRPRTLKRALPRLAVAFLIWNIGLYANNVSQASLVCLLDATFIVYLRLSVPMCCPFCDKHFLHTQQQNFHVRGDTVN